MTRFAAVAAPTSMLTYGVCRYVTGGRPPRPGTCVESRPCRVPGGRCALRAADPRSPRSRRGTRRRRPTVNALAAARLTGTGALLWSFSPEGPAFMIATAPTRTADGPRGMGGKTAARQDRDFARWRRSVLRQLSRCQQHHQHFGQRTDHEHQAEHQYPPHPAVPFRSHRHRGRVRGSRRLRHERHGNGGTSCRRRPGHPGDHDATDSDVTMFRRSDTRPMAIRRRSAASLSARVVKHHQVAVRR